jgi:nitroimidazol reductase NimA-like FMN-containing flavoprotein (pyridoxamine 5'-phosphate oxidase superfamily)
VQSRTELEQILREEGTGYLAVAVDGQPYVVPLNYLYRDGKILFHCALTGQKRDAIRRNPAVCFTVGRPTGAVRDHAGTAGHPDSDNVICDGRARLLDDLPERAAALNAFSRHYRPDAPAVSAERVARCMAVEVTITDMTGRRDRERHRMHWRTRF